MYVVCADAMCEQSHGTLWQTDEINCFFFFLRSDILTTVGMGLQFNQWPIHHHHPNPPTLSRQLAVLGNMGKRIKTVDQKRRVGQWLSSSGSFTTKKKQKNSNHNTGNVCNHQHAADWHHLHNSRIFPRLIDWNIWRKSRQVDDAIDGHTWRSGNTADCWLPLPWTHIHTARGELCVQQV